jgi:hypothetical protein
MYRLSAAVLLLAGTLTFAQAPEHSAPAVASAQSIQAPRISAPHDPIPSTGCPVGFFANRQAATNLVIVDRARQKDDGPAQGLHLMLNRLSQPAIQSIEVTVYGTSLSPKPYALPVAPPSDDLISKTFGLHRTTGSDSLSEADVWMHQVGSVRWADLISITYTDGTTWHAASNLKCRAVPSNFLLVGVK